MNKIIETERLLLRELQEDDADDLLKLFADPVAMRFFPSVKSRKEVDDWIKKNLKSYFENEYGLYMCVLKESSESIGYCGLILQKDVDGQDEVEIGYGLIRSFWHKGYATEAAIGCKKFGFEKLELEKVISLIRPENTASVSVALRNGMKLEKEINRWDYIHGIYSITGNAYYEELKHRIS